MISGVDRGGEKEEGKERGKGGSKGLASVWA